jgi:hypothetical protein
MVLGGVPYYLTLMRRGECFSAFVNRLFFSGDAPLQGEFELFDVRGGAVYLFELKFCDGVFTMTRAEAEKLQLRKQVLNAHFEGRRSIVVCLLAPEGVRGNEHSRAAVDLILDTDALFRDGES